MITKSEIDAASSTLTEVDISNLVAVIRTSERYKKDPGYFTDLQSTIEGFDGSTEAKIINAVIDKLELLGITNVEINQSQTVGTDGVIYSKVTERNFLVDYVLNVMYQESFSTATETDDSVLLLSGEYGVGRLPLDYKGYL
jgi:hypothetical protein